MNKTDRELQRNRRTVKACEGHLADVLLEQKTLIERIEEDLLPEDGVATTREIYEGLGLVEA